jgi:hypothetical protein
VLTNLLGETDLLDLDPYRTPPIDANPVTSNPNLPILRLGVTVLNLPTAVFLRAAPGIAPVSCDGSCHFARSGLAVWAVT